MTFIALKYASSTNYIEIEATAISLCMAIVENYYEDDLSLVILKKNALLSLINGSGKYGAFNAYFKTLNNDYHSYKHKSIHDRLIEIIKLNINTTFSTSFQQRKCLLTKDNFIIKANEGSEVEFQLMDDGLLKLHTIKKGEIENKRNYIFQDTAEFAAFTKNLEENIDIDDKVIKMVFI